MTSLIKTFHDAITNSYKYRYLLKQLVLRDFKIRYKRSILGVFWSILNPTFTAIVLNIVFSTIFKNVVDNYLAYLISGLILYSYFNESTNFAMGSVVGGSSLISKVYIPKYIFPLSKILSSAINLAASFIPLLVILIFSRIIPSWRYLAIPYVIICLMIFALGLGFILSTLAVFFGDMQFLYSIALMMWMYFTPIMYPNSVLESRIWLLILNPLYYYISFFRKIVLDGIIPSLTLFAGCALFAVFFLCVGLIIFKKNQDKFVLHL